MNFLTGGIDPGKTIAEFRQRMAEILGVMREIRDLLAEIRDEHKRNHGGN